MSEDYWDRRRRHLNEDHEFRREQSKRDIELIKGKIRIEQLTAEIRRRERSEQLKTLLDKMDKEKTFVLKRISACSSVRKDRWYEHLSSIDLTHPGADAELKNLLEEMERARRLWSDKRFDLPEWWKSLPGADSWLSTKSESIEKRRPSTPLNAVELRLELEQKDRERERKLIEEDLAFIVSSLGLLISIRDLYESTLSKL